MATASAATNTGISFGGILVNSNFPDLTDARFKEITDRAWKIPVEGLEMFDVVQSDREYEKFSSVTGLGLVAENDDEDDLPVEEIIQGFDHTITPKTYRKTTRVTRKMREDDMYGKIDKQQKYIANSVMYTAEYYAALPWNTGFTNAAAWTCSDGMYLFDSARPTPDQRVATWSNLETGALTNATFSTMRVNFQKITQEKGLVAPQTMGKLVVPVDLEQKAREILGSADKPETALNDTNWNKGAVDIKVWHYLTSTTAWFGVAKEKDLNEVRWVWRIRPTHSSYREGSNDDVFIQKVRMRFASGAGVPYAHRGSTGS